MGKNPSMGEIARVLSLTSAAQAQPRPKNTYPSKIDYVVLLQFSAAQMRSYDLSDTVEFIIGDPILPARELSTSGTTTVPIVKILYRRLLGYFTREPKA